MHYLWWFQTHHSAACQARCLTHPAASNQPNPEPTPSQSPQSTVCTAAAPAHLSTSYPESAVNTPSWPLPEHPPPSEAIVEPQQPTPTSPSTPESPLASTTPLPKQLPPKTALVLARLMDYNKQGLKEPWTLHSGPCTFAPSLPVCYVTLSVLIDFFFFHLVPIHIKPLKT